MMKNLLLRIVIYQAVVYGLLVTETLSQSYTRSYNGYVFTLPGVRVYWANNNAQAWCSQNGSRLLEIKNSYIQNLTIQFLYETGVQFADGTLLITNGLRTDRSSWNWVNGQGINGITITGQGQDLANGFGYINFNLNDSRLYISADIPTEIRGYICQVAGKLDCANGFSHNKLCYESYNSPRVSWFDARNRCLNEGGDLASFDFINDNNELDSTLKGSWLSSSLTYWVGLRRQWWTWQLSNLEANYTNWLNGRPGYRLDSPCLCLYKSGGDWKWIERDCNSVLQFVCLTEPSTSTVTTTIIRNTATHSSGFRNSSEICSSITTKDIPLSTPTALGDTANYTMLGIGIGVGIGGALLIAAIIIVVFIFIRKRRCPSYQARPLTNISGEVVAVTQAHSTNRRNPQMDKNVALEMASEHSTSPYESLRPTQDGTAINDRHYQELHIHGRGEANDPETHDYTYEPVRSY